MTEEARIVLGNESGRSPRRSWQWLS